ncbi:hypothetical protein H0H81_000534 [Sphagnurus paluster]|uniref:Cytochrome P450 n=1 Tax=Sphagnurus paluster TaxID=117069 RepID=A0A9P7GNM9_9AGAR|nr:hypothetical protein H0H81_000534 [Sphagnurus paluster]
MFSLSLVRQFAPFLSKLGAPSFRRMVVEWTPNQAVQKVKNISDIMHNTAQEILRSKVAAITGEHKEDSAEPACAKDLISVLCQWDCQVIHSDTTSSALSRILYMLSKHPKIQDNVRNEVREKLRERQAQGDTSGRLCYDEVTSLPLLDAVIKETLRLYPPVPFVRRTTIKERTVSYSSGDSKDSAGLSSVTIPVGTTIFISIAGSNRLKSVWGPDAKQWKPARWLGGAPASVRLPGIYGGT